jgi:hypothetical protein
MAKSRLTQHKAQRDTTSPLKENRALKQENRSLRRQLSKLRKQMGRMVDSHMSIQQITSEEVENMAPEGAPAQAGGCVGCGGVGNIVSFQIPGSQTVLSVCKTCGHKERTKK